MLNNFVGKDIINIGDMTPDQFQYLLDLSKMLKAEKMTGVDHARFHNKNVVAHFEWESTRTRCAFETSCHDLGLGFTYLSNSHFGNKETVKDSIRVFSEMYDAIVLRAQREEAYVREVADIATIPVINACCEGDHPTQMLADALTMQELLGNLKAASWPSWATAPPPPCGTAACARFWAWTSTPWPRRRALPAVRLLQGEHRGPVQQVGTEQRDRAHLRQGEAEGPWTW